MKDIKNLILSKRTTYHIFDITENSPETLDFIASKLSSGKDIIQLNMINISTKDFYEISSKIRQLCAMLDVLLIINDRIDIASLIDADGVFLSKDSPDIKTIRNIYDNNKIIGSDFYMDADYIIADREIQNKITYPLNNFRGAYKAVYEVKNDTSISN